MVDAITGNYLYTEDKSHLLARIKRMVGQGMGVQRMIEEDRYCLDVFDQLTALSAAAGNLSLLILGKHIQGCVSGAIHSENSEEQVRELMTTIRKTIRR